MDRLNYSDLPRFVLNVEAAESWLAETVRKPSAKAFRAARSPMDGELSFDPRWALSSLKGPGHSAQREMLANMLTAAQEIGVLSAPDGVTIEMESGDDGFRFLVRADYRWEGLLLAGRDILFENLLFEEYGPQALVSVLMFAAREGNRMLSSMVRSASMVLAQFSTDPLLVTRLADHDEPSVRAVAADNPVAPEEAQVLRALRDRNEENV